MKYKHILLDSDYWDVAHEYARRSRTAWLCSCGLQDGYDVTRLFRYLPDAKVIIGVPHEGDSTRDLERSRNAIRHNARVWPKHQFRELVQCHYKFHLFFVVKPKDTIVAFLGSMNMTTNRWMELMIQCERDVAEELCDLHERLWRKARTVEPHDPNLLKNLSLTSTTRPMDTD